MKNILFIILVVTAVHGLFFSSLIYFDEQKSSVNIYLSAIDVEIAKELQINKNQIYTPMEIVVHYNPNQFEEDQNELECLTLNLYREARNQGYNGLLAVGSVTRNRVKDKRYPDTYCEVIYQPWQFSWTLKKELRNKPNLKNDYQKKYWHISQDIAKAVLRETVSSNVGHSTHYHNLNVSPKWSKKLKKVKKIREHIFYL